MVQPGVHRATTVVALIGLAGISGLVLTEIRQGGTCPLLLGVPACYFILACILMVVVSHFGFLRDRHLLFFAGAGAAWVVAIIASVLQGLGRVDCPKGFGDIPLCYVSLVLFSTLVVLKVWDLRRHSASSRIAVSSRIAP